MQFVNQVIQFLQQGIAAIFRFIQLVFNWTIDQVSRVPWSQFGSLPLWKQILILLAAGVIGYALYKYGKELAEAVESALGAFAKLLSAFISVLVPALIVGVAIAGVAWVVNNVNVAWLP